MFKEIRPRLLSNLGVQRLVPYLIPLTIKDSRADRLDNDTEFGDQSNRPGWSSRFPTKEFQHRHWVGWWILNSSNFTFVFRVSMNVLLICSERLCLTRNRGLLTLISTWLEVLVLLVRVVPKCLSGRRRQGNHWESKRARASIIKF